MYIRRKVFKDVGKFCYVLILHTYLMITFRFLLGFLLLERYAIFSETRIKREFIVDVHIDDKFSKSEMVKQMIKNR